MNKSDIISRVALRANCKEAVVKKAVNVTLKLIKEAIAAHGRVEMRGFGAFSVKTYEGDRYVRNPATGVAEYVRGSMELSIKLTQEECGCLKGFLELALTQGIFADNIYGAEQVLASIQRKLLFEMSKIQCPYCESYNFADDQAEKLRKCLECGNEFECG